VAECAAQQDPGGNLLLLRSEPSVSTSTTLVRSSSIASAKAGSASGDAGNRPVTPQTLEEWLDESLPKMEELSRNETLRREITRKLS
jgi:hypothetical protein